MQKIDVSISIVHYKDYSLTKTILRSIFLHPSILDIEVIVVDNDEKEVIKKKIVKDFPKVIYIKSKRNRGYGAGNNTAFKSAHGKYFFVLNPDTRLTKSVIEKLFIFLEKNSDIAIAAPQLINENGETYNQLGTKTLTPIRGIVVLSFLNKLFPNNPISKGYMTKVSDNKPTYVDCVPGSALMIRADIFEKVGMYDERFFLYFEESDLGKRIRDAGYKIAIIPKARVIHLWEGTTKGSKRAGQAFLDSRYLYFKKHYGVPQALLVEFFARFSKWSAISIATLLLLVILSVI